MPEPGKPAHQTAEHDIGLCARCRETRAVRHMVRLKSGRFLCQRCVAVLRGKVGRTALKARVEGTETPPAAPRATPAIPDVEDISDPDLGIEGIPEPTDPRDVAEVDSLPCPKCGESVIFGMPTCEACGIILDDYWTEEEVLHPLSIAARHQRVLWRAFIITAVVAVGYLAWPTKEQQLRWESMLRARFAGPGESLAEKTRGVPIHPSIQRVGRKLVVRNDDPHAWTDIEITINAGAGGRGGYHMDLVLLRSGEVEEFFLANFRTEDGIAFSAVGVPIERIHIRAGTPDGLALWSITQFVDATEVGILD